LRLPFRVSLAFEEGQDGEQFFVQIEEEFLGDAIGKFRPRGRLNRMRALV
jgi:hypothetical protein